MLIFYKAHTLPLRSPADAHVLSLAAKTDLKSNTI